jgi:hypothetical protein
MINVILNVHNFKNKFFGIGEICEIGSSYGSGHKESCLLDVTLWR